MKGICGSRKGSEVANLTLTKFMQDKGTWKDLKKQHNNRRWPSPMQVKRKMDQTQFHAHGPNTQVTTGVKCSVNASDNSNNKHDLCRASTVPM